MADVGAKAAGVDPIAAGAESSEPAASKGATRGPTSGSGVGASSGTQVGANAPSAPAPGQKPSSAQVQANVARKKADQAWKIVHRRLSVARGEFNSFISSGEESYNKGAAKNSDKQFNRATKDWQRAAAVEIPTAEHSTETDLANLRAVAKEWLAAALALFGLFSFTALFFGADTLKVFEEQSKWPTITFSVAAVVAIAGALACCFFGTRAAHGWPPKGAEFVDENKKPRRRSALEKIESARKDLRLALFGALATVVGIVFAAGIALGSSIAGPAPVMMKINLLTPAATEETPAPVKPEPSCGRYKSADSDGVTVVIDAANETIPWSQVERVEALRSC